MIDMNSLVPENYSEIKLNVLPGEWHHIVTTRHANWPESDNHHD
jgi:hypothetical protein